MGMHRIQKNDGWGGNLKCFPHESSKLVNISHTRSPSSQTRTKHYCSEIIMIFLPGEKMMIVILTQRANATVCAKNNVDCGVVLIHNRTTRGYLSVISHTRSPSSQTRTKHYCSEIIMIFLPGKWEQKGKEREYQLAKRGNLFGDFYHRPMQYSPSFFVPTFFLVFESIPDLICLSRSSSAPGPQTSGCNALTREASAECRNYDLDSPEKVPK